MRIVLSLILLWSVSFSHSYIVNISNKDMYVAADYSVTKSCGIRITPRDIEITVINNHVTINGKKSVTLLKGSYELFIIYKDGRVKDITNEVRCNHMFMPNIVVNDVINKFLNTLE